MKQNEKLAFVLGASALCAASALGQQPTDATQPAANVVTTQDRSDAPAKPKKVWTDDDVRHGGSSAAAINARDTKTRPGSAANSKDSPAAKLKEQLTKLQVQLDDTNAKLAELEKFNGDNSSDTAIKLNHHLDRTSIVDQIAKLESKKKQLQEQIQNIYDQARHSGIEPGALR